MEIHLHFHSNDSQTETNDNKAESQTTVLYYSGLICETIGGAGIGGVLGAFITRSPEEINLIEALPAIVLPTLIFLLGLILLFTSGEGR